MAELVDALDLGSSAARRGGSSPFIRTILKDLFINLFKIIIGTKAILTHLLIDKFSKHKVPL